MLQLSMKVEWESKNGDKVQRSVAILKYNKYISVVDQQDQLLSFNPAHCTNGVSKELDKASRIIDRSMPTSEVLLKKECIKLQLKQ